MNDKLKIYACSGVDDSRGFVQDIVRVERVVRVEREERVVRELSDGWKTNETLRKYLGTSKDGGCAEYFLYIFIPDSDLSKYKSIIYKKRQQQLKTYSYVRELFVSHNYGTEAEMLQIIRDGIEATFGRSVEDVLAGVRGAKVSGVGDPVIIAAIISAVVSVVLAVISGIIQYCQNVSVAKYTAPSYADLEASMPSDTDVTKNTKNNIWLWGGLAAVGVWLFKRFYKN